MISYRRDFRLNSIMVKMLRKQMRMTQQSLADKTGMSIRTIYEIENGLSPNPRLTTIGALCQALEVEIGQLIFTEPRNKT